MPGRSDRMDVVRGCNMDGGGGQGGKWRGGEILTR